MELYELGIAEAKEGLAKGDFSSVELTQAIIDRVHAKDGEIGAYLTFDEEGALAAAREADKALNGANGLQGIPIAIKDLINVKGQPCTCASKILEGYVSPYDATVIAKLKAAGIPSMVYYAKPMHHQGAFAETDSAIADCPVTEQLCATVLSLPLDPYKTKEDIEFVVSELKKAL